MEPGSDSDMTDWTEQTGKALAAGAGALAGLPLGPVGVVGGAIAGPLLEPLTVEIMHRVGQAGKRRSGEVLAVSSDIGELSAEELYRRISGDERLELLAGMAMSAAMRTTWEGKVHTLGRSLASGLLASDDAEIDIEQLIMSAISDIEGPHLALLDFLVSWEHPPDYLKFTGPRKVGIADHSRVNNAWDVGSRKWTVAEISRYRRQLAPVLRGLLGTLQRHGLAFSESIYIANTVIEADQRVGGLGSVASTPTTSVSKEEATWEPTELGERVWLRFNEAGAEVPDAWRIRAES